MHSFEFPSVCVPFQKLQSAEHGALEKLHIIELLSGYFKTGLHVTSLGNNKQLFLFVQLFFLFLYFFEEIDQELFPYMSLQQNKLITLY
jgi:hypothetical protein